MLSPRLLTAGIVAVVLAVLTCVQIYFDRSAVPVRKWFDGTEKHGVSFEFTEYQAQTTANSTYMMHAD